MLRPRIPAAGPWFECDDEPSALPAFEVHPDFGVAGCDGLVWVDGPPGELLGVAHASSVVGAWENKETPPRRANGRGLADRKGIDMEKSTDTAPKTRERYAEAMEDYDSWDHLIDKVMAVRNEELERLRERAEKAEYDLEIRTHTARSNGRAHRIAYEESEKQRQRAEQAEAERDALKAAIEDVKTCWPDPFGNWSAKEAHAARAVKEHMLRRLLAVLDTPSTLES